MEVKLVKKYTGNIAIVGKPNVGKSTLINAIFNQKISIINQKPQTTRNKISAHFVNEEFDLTFIDTPGFHLPRNKLDLFLNSEAKQGLKEADLVYFLSDITRPIDQEDEDLLELIADFNVPHKILVITKAETSQQEIIDQRIKELNEKWTFDKDIIISALHKININKLLDISKAYLEQLDVVETNDSSTLQEDNFLVSEIIREQCLNLLKQEIPYGIAVLIESAKYDSNTNVYAINACIVVEKESQKSIVIGKNGSMIKQIGMQARKELLDIYDSKIDLRLFVKVDKNWRDNELKLKEFGYYR